MNEKGKSDIKRVKEGLMEVSVECPSVQGSVDEYPETVVTRAQ